MLFWVFGSSAAGKTTLVDGLRGSVANLEAHDFDERLPATGPATLRWRHDANEWWLQRALELQARGVDLFVAGQTPLAELLATPTAPLVDSIAACLLDCDDDTRTRRIEARGHEWFARAGGTLDDYLAWGRWMREHAVDPTHVIEAIRQPGDGLEWSRLDGWERGDPRWRVHVIVADGDPAEMIAAATAWIAAERGAVH